MDGVSISGSVGRDDKSHQGHGELDERRKRTEALASAETKALSCLRIVVLLVLLATGAITATLTYIFTSSKETDEFQATFTAYANKIFESLHEQVDLKLSAVDLFAADIASYARDSKSQWPMVTVPDFEMKSYKLRTLSNALCVFFMPIVTNETMLAWLNYSTSPDNDWLSDSIDLVNEMSDDNETKMAKDGLPSEMIYTYNGSFHDVTGPGPFVPLWQVSPPIPYAVLINFNMLGTRSETPSLLEVIESHQAVYSRMHTVSESDGGTGRTEFMQKILAEFVKIGDFDRNSTMFGPNEPLNFIVYPVFDNFRGSEKNLVGVVMTLMYWRFYLFDILPSSVGKIILVVEDSRPEVHTYEIDGKNVEYLGPGDLHDRRYNYLGEQVELFREVESDNEGTLLGRTPLSRGYMNYTISVYPTEDLESDFTSYAPIFYTILMAGIFLLSCIAFLAYDWLVERRQRIVLRRALQSTAIVSSLFPAQIRDRLIETTVVDIPTEINGSANVNSARDYENSQNTDESPRKGFLKEPARLRLRNVLRDKDSVEYSEMIEAKPIADFFPNCTVLFADIVGFTAWSSQREPTQVFMLLQSVYQEFDAAARRRGVFKVETIGDCYLAVTGLPNPQENHATIMAGFALECRSKMVEVVRKLERYMGPDTGDLCMRFGLHSGPVTAGVLRGERSRFQLFGDTVNTAARMESTGKPHLIHASEATARLLIVDGNGHWVTRRDGKVAAKGKGDMDTFWIDERDIFSTHTRRASVGPTSWVSRKFSSRRDIDSDDDVLLRWHSTYTVKPRNSLQKLKGSSNWGISEVFDGTLMPKKRDKITFHSRMIEWNVDILLGLLKRIVARRQRSEWLDSSFSDSMSVVSLREKNMHNGASIIDEVTEIITLPTFDPELVAETVDPDSIVLGEDVEYQVREYVRVVASMYRDNPFHNFEHACHVQMAMIKLLQRVVTPDAIDYDAESAAVASDAHNYTYGITSDPLTQFAVVFCALIHDVDHTGVSNGQLIKERAHIATLYKNKSVAEQNSIDLAWDLLMDPRFEELRGCIYTNESERKRFRQLVVNVVLATDIFDKELSSLRKNRWIRAFNEVSLNETPTDNANRKATIVIEHLIQASDVSHTMQHWDIYRKWNRRLFDEMFLAYKSGRTEDDPSVEWYKGELWFFDNYVIPLAKKLKECAVFGVSSDECLNYAVENRNLWAANGKEIVEEMLAENILSRDNTRKLSPHSSLSVDSEDCSPP